MILFTPVQKCHGLATARKVRLRLDGPLEMRAGSLLLADLPQRHPQVVLDDRLVRAGRRASEDLGRLLVLAGAILGPSHGIEVERILGFLQPARQLGRARDRRAVVAVVADERGEVVRDEVVPGVDREHRLVLRDRAVVVAALLQGLCEQVAERDAARQCGEPVLRGLLGAPRVASREQDVREIDVRGLEPRLLLRRASKQRCRLVVLPLRCEHLAEHHLDQSVVRVRPRRLAQSRQGLVGALLYDKQLRDRAQDLDVLGRLRGGQIELFQRRGIFLLRSEEVSESEIPERRFGRRLDESPEGRLGGSRVSGGELQLRFCL